MNDQRFDYACSQYAVIDGDTLKMTLTKRVDLGFGVVTTCEQPARLRLAGLDAKPLKTPDGDAARVWLVTAIDGAPLRVVTVKNRLGVEQHEKYGRYLAYLFGTAPDGTMIVPSLNERMVAAGVATPWDGRGPHPT